MTAEITNIFHLSSHDGRGARTTIFMKGCSLRCAWCHNPETISFSREVMWKRELCIGCGECMRVCENMALKLSSETNFIERERCVACGKCVDICPSKALHFASRPYSVEELTKVIRKDKPLFQSMNGGVTFSGGEPALQHTYINKVIESLNDPTIHYALDTCGEAPFSHYELLVPKFDQILFDIKEMNDERHKEFTGIMNGRIVDNLRKIVTKIELESLSTKIWIRTPLVPKHTASKENIEAIAKLLSSLPKDIVERWELCCFNNLCSGKYRELGIDWRLIDEDLMDQNEAKEYLSIAKKSVPDLDVRVSGLTKR